MTKSLLLSIALGLILSATAAAANFPPGCHPDRWTCGGPCRTSLKLGETRADADTGHQSGPGCCVLGKPYLLR
jgi:hypothetical protein